MNASAKHFLLVLAASLMIAACYVAWYSLVSNKSKAVADLQGQITTQTETVARIASARAALTEISGDEAKVKGYFVPESRVVSFIDDLESRGLAEKAPVKVLSVSTGGSANRPTLLLSLSIQGSFDAVMRTIGAIEYAPYDIRVSTLSIEQSAKGSWQANLNLVVGSVPMKTAITTP